MTSLTPTSTLPLDPEEAAPGALPAHDSLARRIFSTPRVVVGGGIVLATILLCVGSLPWTLRGPVQQPGPGASQPGALYYDNAVTDAARTGPALWPAPRWFGRDIQGRSILARCLLGGVVSLAVGASAAIISIVLGVSVGLISGYRGGWLDALLMRSVDIFYGLPYILLIILLKIALQRPLEDGWQLGPIHSPAIPKTTAALVELFLAIGLVSWLTMARVVRGQVLMLRTLPFIEACRAGGLKESRIFLRHLLPNLIGPVSVYATLTVPQAILQESFLSFLGIGVVPPIPSWGSLASEGLSPALDPIHSYWWMLVFPCTLLAVTLLSLNFLGDGLRDVFDPKRDTAKI